MLMASIRAISLVAGILAAYLALFMYEDDEGNWQNRTEELWVAVNDKAKQTGNRTSALFARVARIVTLGFNRVVGPELISFQFVGVSTSFSIAAFCLSSVPIGIDLLRHPLPVLTSLDLAFRIKLGICVGLSALLIGALPSLWPSRWSIAATWMTCIAVPPAFIHLMPHHFLGMSGALFALPLSVLSDLFLLALVRRTTRQLSEDARTVRIVLAVLIQVGVITFVTVAPLAIGAWLSIKLDSDIPFLFGLMEMTFFNLFTALASSVFMLVLVFVLLHRLFWPLLSRLIYPVARHQVFRHRKALLTIASCCLAFAVPSWAQIVKNVADIFAK